MNPNIQPYRFYPPGTHVLPDRVNKVKEDFQYEAETPFHTFFAIAYTGLSEPPVR